MDPIQGMTTNMINPAIPLQNPLFIFTVIILTILLAPLVFKLIKIPDVAAYLLAGIILGPFGFCILDRDPSVVLLGTIGLLYIMFLAGFDLNMKDFVASKKSSIIFGSLTFLFPFIIGFILSRYILNLNFLPALLVSIMFSSHTLVAYPVARKLGIVRDRSVLSAVGGTIITDTLVLLILSVITSVSTDTDYVWSIIRLITLFMVYLIIIVFSVPRIAIWFLRNIKHDRPIQYLLLLSLVCLSATLAVIMGIEPIIGAFIAGLSQNHVVPKNSMLIHHIEFVGNILFIPVFLISIGMLIDLRILFQGLSMWYVAFILISGALAGKWIAAFLTQKIMLFTYPQQYVLFGLTSSHAAATVAVILVGYNKKLIDDNIFNAAILIILATSLIGTIITERGGKMLVCERSTKPAPEKRRIDRILVPIANPLSMTRLVKLAMQMNTNNEDAPVYAISIVKDDKEAADKLIFLNHYFDKALETFNMLAERIRFITRIDLNVANGILRASKELMITGILIGWSSKTSTAQKFFGNIFYHLLKSNLTLYACNLASDIEKLQDVKVFLYRNTDLEPAFGGIMNKLLPLVSGRETRLTFYITPESAKNLNPVNQFFRRNKEIKYRVFNSMTEIETELSIGNPGTLQIIFVGRKQFVSYDFNWEKIVNNYASKNKNGSFILIFPGIVS
jgi:Kef-type K+ transport system membrane component KefB